MISTDAGRVTVWRAGDAFIPFKYTNVIKFIKIQLHPSSIGPQRPQHRSGFFVAQLLRLGKGRRAGLIGLVDVRAEAVEGLEGLGVVPLSCKKCNMGVALVALATSNGLVYEKQ